MWDQLLKNPEKLKKINQTAFDAIDLNNDGNIQKSELEQIMASTALSMEIEKPSKEEIKEVMKELDRQSKGYLTKQDFSVLVQQVLKIMKKNQQK